LFISLLNVELYFIKFTSIKKGTRLTNVKSNALDTVGSSKVRNIYKIS